MKLKQSIKDSQCYSVLTCVHFRPNKYILQEMWIFLAYVMTLRKAGTYVYNYSDLENCMSLASRTSNAIVIWLILNGSMYVYYKHIC